MCSKINIAIADDEELFLKGFSLIFSKFKRINILFEASNGRELINFLDDAYLLPDVILLDIKMPELKGVETTKEINYNFPDVKIIALSSYYSKSFMSSILSIGASAYLRKNTSPENVIYTIEQVYKNGFFTDRNFLKIKNPKINPIEESSNRFVDDQAFLTYRETEILKLICRQYTNVEIGNKLFISSRTVEVHRKNLLAKTKAKNSAGLVVFAFNNGLDLPLFEQPNL